MKKTLPLIFCALTFVMQLFKTNIATAQLIPFACRNGVAYQVAGTPNSSLFSYNVITGERSVKAAAFIPVDRTSAPVAPLGTNIRINATGYSPIDNLIWGWEDLSLGQVVRIDTTGKFERYTIPNLPSRSGANVIAYNCGEVLPDGYLILYRSNETVFYTIDINPNRPATYLQLVNPATKNVSTTGTTLTEGMNVNDFVYNSTTGLIQSMNNASGGNAANHRKIVTLNPRTGTIAYGAMIKSDSGVISDNNISNENGNFGAVFLDANDNFFVFANNSSNFYRVNTTTNIATHLSKSTQSNNNDGANCPNAVIAFSIKGTVYADGNALIGSPANTIDGRPTSINGTLKAALYNNTTGKVDDLIQVKADGTFELSGLPYNNYTIYITASAVTVGQPAVPTTSLPERWSYVGELNRAGVGTDGTANGVLILGLLDENKFDNKFGVAQKPEAISVTHKLTNNPTNDDIVRLDGTSAPMLIGRDYEDQPDSGALVNQTIHITSLPTNGTLYYQGTPILLGADNINPPSLSNPFVISHLSEADLHVQLTNLNYTTIVFEYAFVDQANQVSAPAAYTIDWSSPLPVHLIDFRIVKDTDCKQIAVQWTSGVESDFNKYILEGTTDAVNFTVIGATNAKGSNNTYDFVFNNHINTVNYLRLKMVDNDLSYSYSKVIKVNGDCTANNAVVVYPTITQNKIQIDGLQATNTIEIWNAAGARMHKLNATDNNATIDLSGYSNGMYFVVITSGASIQTFKIIKN